MKGEPFKKVLAILKGVAPTAVAALTGPYAPLAAGVMRKVLNVERTDDAGLEEAVIAAAGDPSTVAKLRQIEAELVKHESDLGIRFEELANEDRADARAREIATRDPTTRNLAYIMVGAFIAVAAGVLLGWAAVDSTLAGTIIGYMVGEAKQVIAYYFGSSAGSKQKTELMGGK